MTNRFIRTGRTLAAIFAVVCIAFAAPATRAQEVRLHLSDDSVTVGQRFYLSISAEHDFAADPQFPSPTDSLVFGDLEVLRRHARDSFSRDGMRIDSVVYEVTTFALDTAAVAPIPVLFTAGEDTFTVRTPARFVPVVSLVPADAEDIRDLAPLVEFPRPLWAYIAAAAGILLLIALIALYVARRRRRRPEEPAAPPRPPEPPHVEALKRLRALESVNLDSREAVQPFYTELSDTLRLYLARRLHVNALETTTRELIRELSQRDSPGPNTRRYLRDVLSLADFVKFADVVPPAEKGREALGTARDVVTSVEDELRPPEPSTSDAPASAHP